MNTLPAYDWALNLLIVQGAMGAFDTLYHHELTQDLPHSARSSWEFMRCVPCFTASCSHRSRTSPFTARGSRPSRRWWSSR